MVKRRDSKTNLSKIESTPGSSVATSPSGASTPIISSGVNTVDWNKVNVTFKNPNFKVRNQPLLSFSPDRTAKCGLKAVLPMSDTYVYGITV